MRRFHLPSHSNRWLALIGLGKVLKGMVFIALGFGALHLVHKDLLSVVTDWVTDLRFDPEGRFVNFLLDHVAGITPHRLRQISLGIFVYAAVDLTEGGGLVLGKTWAEYLTLILSVALLPLDFAALLRRPAWPKAAFTLINLLVVWYLAAYLQRRARERARRLAQPESHAAP